MYNCINIRVCIEVYMDTNIIVQYLLKTYPEVTVSHNDTIEAIMKKHGRREVAVDILRLLGRDEKGRHIDS